MVSRNHWTRSTLKRGSFITLGHLPVITDTNHGTATSGIMYANDIGFGVKGLVHGADKFYAVLANIDFMSPLLELYQYLEAGDVISISYSYPDGPLDTSPFDWDVFKTGLEAGILISISAGNDNFNLDDSCGGKLDEWHKRPDIGLIHAGAGNKQLIKRERSSYGSMVNLQAWGSDVVTTGYGDLYGDEPNNQYTKDFSGTSAASPIIASAIVAVQSWYKQQTGNVLKPFEMRELLIQTGTPQCKEWWLSPSEPLLHIGSLPNVRKAINELRERLSHSTVRAIVEGPVIIYTGKKATLSAKKSKSNVADITSYNWQLPGGITTDILNQSTLTFIAPKLTESQKFLINLTVTDALGNSSNTTHTVLISTLPKYQSWEPRKVYRVGDIVSWKNKIWIAKIDSIEMEPGTNDEIWEAIG